MKKSLIFLLCVFAVVGVISGTAHSEEIVRVAIARFESATSEATDQDAAAVTDIFTDTMIHTRSIAVIERTRLEEVMREQRMSMSGIVDASTAAKVGRLLGCKYIILGSVTQLKETNTKIRNKNNTTTKVTAEATLYARVIDTDTGEVTYSDSYTAQAVSRSEEKHHQDYDIRRGMSGMKQQAITSAAKVLSSKIREAIVDESARVIAVERGVITLNRGAAGGVHNGDYYLVYIDGPEMRDLDGTVLGTEVLNIAIIEVYEVQEKYCRAGLMKKKSLKNQIYTGSPALISIGDKTRYLSREEADSIVRNGSFIGRRPGFGDDFGTGPEEFTDDSPRPPRPQRQRPEYQEYGMERTSTKPERVIAGYDIPEGDKKARIAAHKKLIRSNARDRNTYNGYAALANSYQGDYLAAYQAGATALAMGMVSEANEWFSRALAINPDYKPAYDGLAKTQ